MPIDTTDVRSHSKAQIQHALEVLGRSNDRRKVFAEIYRGRKGIKTVDEIALKTNLKRKRVLEEGLVLYKNGLIKREKVCGKFAFIKDDFYSQHKERILRLAKKKQATRGFSTTFDQKTGMPAVIIKLPKPQKPFDIKHITIDEIDSFKKAATLYLEIDGYRSISDIERDLLSQQRKIPHMSLWRASLRLLRAGLIRKAGVKGKSPIYSKKPWATALDMDNYVRTKILP